MTPSIRRQLAIILLPSIAIIWVAAAVLSYIDAREETVKLLDAQLSQTGKVLLAMSMHELVEQQLLAEDNRAFTEIVAKNLWQDNLSHESKLAFQVWLHQETLTLRSENAPTIQMSSKSQGFDEIYLSGDKWRVFATSTIDNSITVQVGVHSDLERSFGNSIIRKILFPMIASLPVLAFFIIIGVNRSMFPLKRIAQELNQRKVNDLSPIDQYKTPTEARPVTTAINHLFTHMKTAFDTERRFTSDAAHELRTPLAALKTHAEIALQASNNPVEQQKALRQVVQGVNRATRLVEQLLTLARLDPETGLTNIRRFDLFIAAENVLSNEAMIAIDKNIEISLSGTRGKFVSGNPDAIAVLMRNLIDNAIRYTPEGGEVQVIISRKDDTVILTVADSGPGIPEEERSKVFNRFYRSLGTKESGSGLGLSIVTRISDLHHLEIKLDTSKMGGLQVNVLFTAKDFDTVGTVVDKNNS